jgi:hypothetical protein
MPLHVPLSDQLLDQLGGSLLGHSQMLGQVSRGGTAYRDAGEGKAVGGS